MRKFILATALLFMAIGVRADVTISDEEYLKPILESNKKAQEDISQLQAAINERLVILDANKVKIETFLAQKPEVVSTTNMKNITQIDSRINWVEGLLVDETIY